MNQGEGGEWVKLDGEFSNKDDLATNLFVHNFKNQERCISQVKLEAYPSLWINLMTLQPFSFVKEHNYENDTYQNDFTSTYPL